MKDVLENFKRHSAGVVRVVCFKPFYKRLCCLRVSQSRRGGGGRNVCVCAGVSVSVCVCVLKTNCVDGFFDSTKHNTHDFAVGALTEAEGRLGH